MFLSFLVLSSGVCYISLKAYQLLAVRPARTCAEPAPHPLDPPPMEGVEESAFVDSRRIEQELALSSLSLGLATGALLFPPLNLAAAPPLLYLTVPTVRKVHHAWRCRTKAGTALFDLLLVTASLATGQPVAAALHFWLRALSRRQLQWLRRTTRQEINRTTLPSEGWVQRHGVLTKTTLNRVKESDILVVQAGELIAVDGVIGEGIALVDEQGLTHQPAPKVKAVEDRVFAATLTLTGELHVKVGKTGEATAVACVERLVRQAAMTKTALQHQGEQVADTLAGPMLGLGALTALVLGPMSAVTLINARPGYDTAQLVALQSLRYLTLAQRAGLVVKHSRVFETVGAVDTVIFNLDLARRPDFGETLRGLRCHALRAVFVLANQPVRARDQLAATLGVDDVWHLPTLAAKIEQIQQLQQQGRTVCYVGNGQDDGPLMACADLSLSVAPLAAVASDAAQVLLLQDRLCDLLCLFALGEQFAAAGKQSIQWTFWPGVASMAGALCGLGLVPSVLLNDLGVLLGAGDLSAVYAVAPEPARPAAAQAWRTFGAEWLSTHAATGPLAVVAG